MTDISGNVTSSPASMMQDILNSQYASSAICVIAALGVPDLISSGYRDITVLSRKTRTNVDRLKRLLRLLVAWGVLLEDDDGDFDLTELGRTLRSDVRHSMHARAIMFGTVTQRLLTELLHSVTTGEPSFSKVFGTPCFEYLASHPQHAKTFDTAMSEYTARAAAIIAKAVDLSGMDTVIDIAGGDGTLLAALAASERRLTGAVFELEHAAQRARALFDRTGLSCRLSTIVGDMFDTIPSDADIYMCKHVLHDWDDSAVGKILSNCRMAMKATSRLLIVESLCPHKLDTSLISRRVAGSDIGMLVGNGGKERTAAEWRSLIDKATLTVSRIVSVADPLAIIECAVKRSDG